MQPRPRFAAAGNNGVVDADLAGAIVAAVSVVATAAVALRAQNDAARSGTLHAGLRTLSRIAAIRHVSSKTP
jgi:hypothetical protein